MSKRKYTRKIAALLCMALTVGAFGGCGKSETVQTPLEIPTSTSASVTQDVSSQSNSDAPVFMLEKLPEIGGYVDDIIYKRRYSETRDTLTPGENYGKLIPFVGSFRDYHFVDYETGEWEDETYSVSKYGLMTDKGEIIVDAVYDWVEIYSIGNDDYMIELSMSGENPETVSKRLYCNSDGSLVRKTEDDIYYNFTSFHEGYIIATDRSGIDWETSSGLPKTIVYDTKWNKLFEIDNALPCYEKVYSDGYFVLDIFTDYMNWECESQFVDKKGNIVFEDVHPSNSIANGKTTAEKDGGLYGIFDVSGKWVVQPTFSEMNRHDNVYIGKNFWGASVYDADGKLIKAISEDLENKNIYAYGERIYTEESFSDEDTYYLYHQFTDLETEKVITCAETGMPVTQRLEYTEYFYCDDGKNTYIVNFDGKTVATLPGCGNLWKIDDAHFRMVEGHWEDATQKYTVYSLKTFEKLWSDTIVNQGERVEIWEHHTESFIIKQYSSETEEYYEVAQNTTSDILDIETGKPIFENIADFYAFEIDGKLYLNISDGTYTYAYSPDMTLLMKVRNERND